MQQHRVRVQSKSQIRRPFPVLAIVARLVLVRLWQSSIFRTARTRCPPETRTHLHITPPQAPRSQPPEHAAALHRRAPRVPAATPHQSPADTRSGGSTPNCTPLQAMSSSSRASDTAAPRSDPRQPLSRLSRAAVQSPADRISPVCVRPTAALSRSTKLCTPRLTRFTPSRIASSSRPSAICPGAASSVISASCSTANSLASAAKICCSCSGSSRLGVPPPKYTVSTARGRPASRLAALASVRSISAHSRRTYSATRSGRRDPRREVTEAALRTAERHAHIHTEPLRL